jgi:hypothetical protein
MNDGLVFHYPPELFQLLVQTLPLLCRSKRDVILFFRGCGMSPSDLSATEGKLSTDFDGTSKYALARELLTVLNTAGDRLLRERRELLRRVTQFEDFSSCWPDDQLKAKGCVAEVRRVVNVKDSFTKMAEEKDRERAARASEAREQSAVLIRKKERLGELRDAFLALFAERNPQKRGRALEPVLNNIFEHFEIAVRGSFTRVDEPTGRVIEQIDGVIEFESHHYLVEMKWLQDAVSVDDVSRHLVRVHCRAGARALFVADTKFSPGALEICRDALSSTVVTLVSVEELVHLLDRELDLKWLLHKKIEHAIVDRQPWRQLLP